MAFAWIAGQMYAHTSQLFLMLIPRICVDVIRLNHCGHTLSCAPTFIGEPIVRFRHGNNQRSRARNHGEGLFIRVGHHSNPKWQHPEIHQPRPRSNNLRTGPRKRSVHRSLGRRVSNPLSWLFDTNTFTLQVLLLFEAQRAASIV